MASVKSVGEETKPPLEKMLLVDDKVEQDLRDTLTLMIPKTKNEGRRNTMETDSQIKFSINDGQDQESSNGSQNG